MLLSSLRKVEADPRSERLRKVNTSDELFKTMIAPVPGAVELLFACGYKPMHGHLVLNEHNRRLMALTLCATDPLCHPRQAVMSALRPSEPQISQESPQTWHRVRV